MGDISFLGLGDMGFALASTIAKAGYDTIVWNRTKERATPLLDHGARLASSPVEAISESPIVVVCVSDYETAEGTRSDPIDQRLTNTCPYHARMGAPSGRLIS